MADMASVLASKDMAGLMRTVGLGDAPSGAPSTALMDVSEEPSGRVSSSSPGGERKLIAPAAPGRQATQKLDLTNDPVKQAYAPKGASRKKLKRDTTLGRIMHTSWKAEESRQVDGPDPVAAPKPVSRSRTILSILRPWKGRRHVARDKEAVPVWRNEGGGGGGAGGKGKGSAPGGKGKGSAPDRTRLVNSRASIGHVDRLNAGLNATRARKLDEELGGAPGSAPEPPLRGKLRPGFRSRPLAGHHPDHPFECLVFKGGGAKGSIYPGAIRALEDVGIMPYVKRFAGASAGAITATLLAVGLSAKQLFRELSNADIQALVKDDHASKSINAGLHLYSKFGMHPGEEL